MPYRRSQIDFISISFNDFRNFYEDAKSIGFNHFRSLDYAYKSCLENQQIKRVDKQK